MSTKFQPNQKAVYHSVDKKVEIATVEKKDNVYILHMINKDNRLTQNTIPSLIKAMDDIEADYLNLRQICENNGDEYLPAALVTIGNKHIYSNGLDLFGINDNDLTDKQFFEGFYHKLCLRVLEMPMPTVAAINGHAFAGGMMLALCHDYKVMREDRGFMCMPEIDLPGPLSPGMTSVLRSYISDASLLRDILLQARRLPGPECLKFNLVDKVSKEESLFNDAIEIANKWKGKAVKSDKVYKFLRMEFKAELIDLLKNGGIGYIGQNKL